MKFATPKLLTNPTSNIGFPTMTLETTPPTPEAKYKANIDAAIAKARATTAAASNDAAAPSKLPVNQPLGTLALTARDKSEIAAIEYRATKLSKDVRNEELAAYQDYITLNAGSVADIDVAPHTSTIVPLDKVFTQLLTVGLTSSLLAIAAMLVFIFWLAPRAA